MRAKNNANSSRYAIVTVRKTGRCGIAQGNGLHHGASSKSGVWTSSHARHRSLIISAIDPQLMVRYLMKDDDL